MQPKFVAAQKMLLKQNQQTFKWIARFCYFRHLYPLKRVYCSQYCTSCSIDMGNSIRHCSLIYFWVPSSCFCIVISFSEGVGASCSAVSASRGRLHYPRRRGGGGFTHWLTDCFDVQNWRRPAATSSRRIFSALASANSCVFASSAATSRWRICMSVIAVRQLQFSGIFVALGFVGNGVITVMINSPRQAETMMQITRAGDNRGDLLIHQSLTVPPASLNFAIRLSALCSNWP